MKRTYRIVTSYAVFAMIIEDSIVVDAAPIAKWAIGQRFDMVATFYITRKHAQIEELK